MAKRISDSEKWRDPWFSELNPDLKLLWIYILDNCSHAGIWKINKRLAEFELGLIPGWGEGVGSVPNSFKDRICSNGDYWFIPKFLKWQYGDNLKKGDAFASAYEIIESKGFLEELKRVYGGSIHPLGRVKAKAKAKAISFKEGVEGGNKARPANAKEVEDYGISIGFKVNGQHFIDHYEKSGWVYGKARLPVKDWKACLRTWKTNSLERNEQKKEIEPWEQKQINHLKQLALNQK